MKTTQELAKQAFSDLDKVPAFKNGFYTITPEELEAFRALCVAERDRELLGVGMEPVAWELRKGKTDRVLIHITNNPEIAHNWKYSLEEVVPLHTADQLAAARLQGREEGQQMAQIGRVDQRIAELEAELLEQARVNGMGSEREATLMARVAVLEAQLAECKVDAERNAKLLFGFMLDCNVIGKTGATENLIHGIGEKK